VLRRSISGNCLLILRTIYRQFSSTADDQQPNATKHHRVPKWAIGATTHHSVHNPSASTSAPTGTSRGLPRRLTYRMDHHAVRVTAQNGSCEQGRDDVLAGSNHSAPLVARRGARYLQQGCSLRGETVPSVPSRRKNADNRPLSHCDSHWRTKKTVPTNRPPERCSEMLAARKMPEAFLGWRAPRGRVSSGN
jgi:hypothetical protein